MQVLCLYYYGLRKSNRRLKSELHKQQYTVTLYGCNHQAHVIHVVIGKCKNLCLTVQLILSFILNLMAIKFRVQDQGACIWRGVYMEGLVFGILRQIWKDFKRSKYNGSQGEKFGKIYEINLVLNEIWEKESYRIAKLFMEGNELQ